MLPCNPVTQEGIAKEEAGADSSHILGNLVEGLVDGLEMVEEPQVGECLCAGMAELHIVAEQQGSLLLGAVDLGTDPQYRRDMMLTDVSESYSLMEEHVPCLMVTCCETGLHCGHGFLGRCCD